MHTNKNYQCFAGSRKFYLLKYGNSSVTSNTKNTIHCRLSTKRKRHATAVGKILQRKVDQADQSCIMHLFAGWK